MPFFIFHLKFVLFIMICKFFCFWFCGHRFRCKRTFWFVCSYSGLKTINLYINDIGISLCWQDSRNNIAHSFGLHGNNKSAFLVCNDTCLCIIYIFRLTCLRRFSFCRLTQVSLQTNSCFPISIWKNEILQTQVSLQTTIVVF